MLCVVHLYTQNELSQNCPSCSACTHYIPPPTCIPEKGQAHFCYSHIEWTAKLQMSRMMFSTICHPHCRMSYHDEIHVDVCTVLRIVEVSLYYAFCCTVGSISVRKEWIRLCWKDFGIHNRATLINIHFQLCITNHINIHCL